MYLLSSLEVSYVSGGICPYCLLAGAYYFSGSLTSCLGYLSSNQTILFALSGVLLTTGSYYLYQFSVHLEQSENG